MIAKSIDLPGSLSEMRFGLLFPDFHVVYRISSAYSTESDQCGASTMNLFARLGAVTYVLWGLLHIQAARMVYMLGNSLDAGAVQGRVFQDGFNLLFFALFAIAVAVKFNWKNDRMGYWLNLVVASAADIGFIVYVLMPGYAPMVPGAAGPVLWVLAVIFSTLGIRKS